MAALNVTVKTKTAAPRKLVVEIDAAKFERLAADFGFFNPNFLKSLARAEADYRAGRVKKITSLKELE